MLFFIKQINFVVVVEPVCKTFVPKNPFRKVDFPEEIAPIIGINFFSFKYIDIFIVYHKYERMNIYLIIYIC